MKVDLVTPARIAMVVVFLIVTWGTPLMWLAWYFVLKEVSLTFKFRNLVG